MVMIAGSYSHTVALKGDGTMWAWGDNPYGQLGDGTTVQRTAPVKVAGGLSGVVAASAFAYHTVALKANGTVWAWGDNPYGQLGDGTTTNRTSPVQVKGSGGVGTLSGVVAVAVGNYHTVALKADGTVWTWGDNYFGQFGDGTTTNQSLPVQVKGPEMEWAASVAWVESAAWAALPT